MTMLPLDTARALLDATLGEGRRRGLKPLAAIVLDAGGLPVAFAREDGASNLRFAIAQGKAWGALGLGQSSRAIATMASERASFVGALVGASEGRIIPAAGGVLFYDRGGGLLGAIGVTGDTSDDDEACALAAIEANGLKPGT